MGFYLAEPIADTIAVCTTAPMFFVYYRILQKRGDVPECILHSVEKKGETN